MLFLKKIIYSSMTINDFLSKRMSASEYYKQYIRPNGTTIAKASQEPLTLRALQEHEYEATLFSGKVVHLGEAFCYYCLSDLISRYNRPIKPKPEEICYMADLMMRKYPHWTVLDLPTFVDMVVMSRVPSLYGSGEYQLVVVDFANIMGKVESYDRMRPNPQALQGGSPEKATERPLTNKQMTTLIDGTPYEWTDMEACKRYWRGAPDKDDPHFKANQDSLTAKTSKPIVRTVNDILKSRDFGGTAET